jgi:hypothetical protein
MVVRKLEAVPGSLIRLSNQPGPLGVEENGDPACCEGQFRVDNSAMRTSWASVPEFNH